jgi:hypothetical protein
MSQQLANSRRILPKATFTPLRVARTEDAGGNAIVRAALLRQLSISPDEVSRLKESLTETDLQTTLDLLVQHNEFVTGSPMDGAAALVMLPAKVLIGIIGALRAQREKDLAKAESELAVLPPADPPRVIIQRTGGWDISKWEPRPIRDPKAEAIATARQKVRQLKELVGSCQTVSKQLTDPPPEPLGILFLEKIVLTPMSTERGELVYSLPLAPKEKVTLSHKEWRVRQEEFTQAVQDSFERYSEQGVTEATELAQSMTDVSFRSIASSATTTTHSGESGYAAGTNVTISKQEDATSTLEDITQRQMSRTQSAAHARTVTARASARSVQEHKISFTTTTVAGAEDFTARVLENAAGDKTMRVDYFRVMRRWKVELQRIGLRLTYSVVLPDPAYELRQPYLELQQLEAAIGSGFVFDLPPGQITNSTWQALGDQFGVTLPPPPTTPDGEEAWRSRTWEILRAAAQVRFAASEEQARRRRDMLRAALVNSDSLRLRRLEKEQLMFLVLKWLFPPLNSNSPAPDDTEQFSVGWQDSLEYGDYIRFVHEAIDWDNLLVNLYPYFWQPSASSEKLLLTHPDPLHREFLRAGAAKVVLTIRPGHEEAVLALLDTGKKMDALPERHRFKRVLDEVAKAHARFASMESEVESLSSWEECTPTGALDIEVVVRPIT